MNRDARQPDNPAKDFAYNISLQALTACWMREIAGAQGNYLSISGRDGDLNIFLAEPHRCGAASIREAINGLDQRLTAEDAWVFLLRHMEHEWPATAPEVARKARDSHNRIAQIAGARLNQPEEPLDFLAAEQALICGHWMHPAPKSLGGMSEQEEHNMTPDWHGAFHLQALSVRRDLCTASRPDVAGFLPGFDLHPGEGRILLPAHPLTLDRLSRDPRIAGMIATGDICDLGPVGPKWYATSSVRTLWCPEADYMVKISLPVTITNSQRMNKRHELLAGEVMARRIAGFAGRFGPMRLIADPHWIALDLPGCRESGFEVILRDNPYRGDRGGAVLQVAALSAPPLPGRRSLLHRAVGRLDPAAWFDAYLKVAVAPLLRLYEETGIGFEAHQQNALLDLSQGLPSRCDLRDNQGFFISDDMADAEQRAVPQLVYPRHEVEDALGYTLIVNQVFSIIHRLASDGLLPEKQGLAALAGHLEQLARDLSGHGGRLARQWRTGDDLPMKGNLLTQLGGVDELHIPGERAPFVRIANPISTHIRSTRRLADVA